MTALGVTPEHVRNMVEARFGGLLAADPTVSIGEAGNRPDTSQQPGDRIHATSYRALALLVGLSACSNLTPEQQARSGRC